MLKIKSYLAIFLLVISVASSSFAENQQTDNAFLSISDFHFDPFISCKKTKTIPCPLIQKLRRANAHEWAKILAAEDKASDHYKQDTNYPLLTKSLKTAKSAGAQNQIKFVLVLGDFLGHEYRQYYKRYSQDKTFAGYEAFVKKTMTFLTLQLANTFPNVDVYSALGNNDSYLGDYVSVINSNFYEETGLLWSSLIKNPAARESMEEQFSKAGYYAIDLPNQSNLRLIVLNSVLFSYKARGKRVAEAARAELNWLHRELQSAEKKNQKVFIAMHIPMSYDIYATANIKLFTLFNLWHQQYIQAFKDELNQFSDTIASIFVSHLHSNWHQRYTALNGDDIAIMGTPSISPIFGNDPAFKVYFYDTENFDVDDSITYDTSLREDKGWFSKHTFGDERINLLATQTVGVE